MCTQSHIHRKVFAVFKSSEFVYLLGLKKTKKQPSEDWKAAKAKIKDTLLIHQKTEIQMHLVSETALCLMLHFSSLQLKTVKETNRGGQQSDFLL